MALDHKTEIYLAVGGIVVTIAGIIYSRRSSAPQAAAADVPYSASGAAPADLSGGSLSSGTFDGTAGGLLGGDPGNAGGSGAIGVSNGQPAISSGPGYGQGVTIGPDGTIYTGGQKYVGDTPQVKTTADPAPVGSYASVVNALASAVQSGVTTGPVIQSAIDVLDNPRPGVGSLTGVQTFNNNNPIFQQAAPVVPTQAPTTVATTAYNFGAQGPGTAPPAPVMPVTPISGPSRTGIMATVTPATPAGTGGLPGRAAPSPTVQHTPATAGAARSLRP